MKKITLLFLLLTVSWGFSQTILEDFESPPVGLTGFEGLGGANVVANPNADATNGSATVGELIVVQAGNPWQGADLVMQDNYIDVSVPATNTVNIDVYSTMGFTMLARLGGGQSGAVDSAADVVYTTPGAWQTLTLTFTENLDGTASANGEYEKISFFPNWTGSGYNDPEIENTVYIDNLDATAGNPLDPPPTLPSAAPIPTAPDGETYSIYNDTNGYTTNFPFVYNFGTLDAEPDLDPGAGVNLAFQLDFSVAGWGAGEGGPDDVSAYNFVSFDYYTDSTILPGFRFVLIDNDGAVEEFNYQIGTNEPLVTGAWTQVIIPMSYFTGLGFSDANLFQWKFDPFDQSVVNGDIVWIDNILLTQNDPTLSVSSFETAEVKIYPNPTNTDWTVESPQTIDKIQVFDVLGQRVNSYNPESTQFVIRGDQLQSGLYFARIEGANGSKTVRLVKQ
ncbi:MAG: T9SS type A sorting domain-containing protein [Flavobacteriaceae bacterium]|nr:T9SS type A sorting domain-containing protein [Flavobacteriaceae bacterium]